MKYSALLLYPDYLTSNWGQDTYYAFVEADSPEQAAREAKLQAARNQVWGYRSKEVADDFYLLLLIKGHHPALSDHSGDVAVEQKEFS